MENAIFVRLVSIKEEPSEAEVKHLSFKKQSTLVPIKTLKASFRISVVQQQICTVMNALKNSPKERVKKKAVCSLRCAKHSNQRIKSRLICCEKFVLYLMSKKRLSLLASVTTSLVMIKYMGMTT